MSIASKKKRMRKSIYYILPFILCGFLASPVYAAGTENSTSAQTETASENSTEAETVIPEGDNIKAISEQEGDRTGVVTFVMDVPSEVTDPCIITFTSADSYEEYYAEAFKSAGYTVTANLKPGTYMITDGYPIGDNVSAYSVRDKGYFIVEEGGQQEVDVTIRSKGDIIRQTAEKKELDASDAASTETQDTPEEAVKKPENRKYYAVMAAVLLAIGTGLIITLYKVLKKKEK